MFAERFVPRLALGAAVLLVSQAALAAGPAELIVCKQDVNGQPVPGITFALYENANCTGAPVAISTTAIQSSLTEPVARFNGQACTTVTPREDWLKTTKDYMEPEDFPVTVSVREIGDGSISSVRGVGEMDCQSLDEDGGDDDQNFATCTIVANDCVRVVWTDTPTLVASLVINTPSPVPAIGEVGLGLLALLLPALALYRRRRR